MVKIFKKADGNVFHHNSVNFWDNIGMLHINFIWHELPNAMVMSVGANCILWKLISMFCLITFFPLGWQWHNKCYKLSSLISIQMVKNLKKADGNIFHHNSVNFWDNIGMLHINFICHELPDTMVMSVGANCILWKLVAMFCLITSLILI